MIPRFEVLASGGPPKSSITADLRSRSEPRQARRPQSEGRERRVATACGPKRMPPVLPPEIAERIGCQLYGLEIAPIYRDPETGEVFPRVLRVLRRRLSVALRRASSISPSATQPTGRRTSTPWAGGPWSRPCGTSIGCWPRPSEAFDFLLQVTPVNGEQAWHEFQRKQFEQRPTFHYRPLPAEPVVLKRNLYRRRSSASRIRRWR